MTNANQTYPIRVAYADPPYPGQASKYPENREVCYPGLIAMLEEGFSDGWALSLGSNNLRDILPHCPPKVRVGAWVKTYSTWNAPEGAGYAWEPVIFKGGRNIAHQGFDWVACPPLPNARGNPPTVFGAKPPQFAGWLFRLLGLRPDDEFVDLYPGSGGVTRAWEGFQRQMSLFEAIA